MQEKIDQLQKDYGGKRTAKDSADSDFADTEGRLKALLKLQGDIEKVKQAYEAARDQLWIDQRDYTDYRESEEDSLRKQLKDDKTLATIKKASDDKLARDAKLAQDAVDRKTDLETALTSRTNAADTRKRKADEVTEALQWTATIAAKHTKLKAMSAEVTKAHQAGDYALAYWLLVHRPDDTEPRTAAYDKALQAAREKLIKPEELAGKLLAAVEALATADKDLAGKETAVANARADLAAAEKELADQKAQGEARLRKLLQDMTPDKA